MVLGTGALSAVRTLMVTVDMGMSRVPRSRSVLASIWRSRTEPSLARLIVHPGSARTCRENWSCGVSQPVDVDDDDDGQDTET